MANGNTIVAVIFFILGFIVYLFYRWLTQPRERREYTPKSRVRYSPFMSNPFAKARIAQLHQQHEHKHKEAQKEVLLGTFGKKKQPSTQFNELRQVIHEHHLTKWNRMTSQQQDEFKKLQKIIKQRESRMGVKEREEVMERLRKMRK